MVSKKKYFATLFLAAVMVVTMIPTTPLAAEEVNPNQKEEGSETDIEETGEDLAADKEVVLKDGEVVMDGAIGKVDQSEWITMDDYEQVAESDTYIMYLYEPRLSIILENKATGELLESTLSDEQDDGNSNRTWNAYMKSGIVIQAIINTTNTYQVDLITCENTIDVTKNNSGFSATVFFTEYGFGLTVNVNLTGNELIVDILDDSIVEEKEGTYISTISLYPFMGYTFMDEEEGYMLIPDGNGALIYLDNKEGRYTTGFSQMIYGKDIGFTESSVTNLLWDEVNMVRSPNQVIAPVFGMAHTNKQIGYLAIVEEGEKRASIEAHPNGAMVNYNRCFAKFLLRDIFIQPLNNSNSGTVTRAEEERTHTNLRVRYVLLSGEKADYSGMAVSYRNYLLDQEQVTIKDSTYHTRVDFLGTDREEFLMGTKAVTVTTVDDIGLIYSELQDAGVEHVLSVYQGWQKGGIYNLPISKYKADRHIGGTNALTDLIKESAERNYDLYLNHDALRINPKTNNATFNVVKQVNKRTFEEEYTARVYDTFLYRTPEKTESTLSKFVDSYTGKGVENLALKGITNTLYSYSYQGDYFTRYDCANVYERAVAEISDKTNLLLVKPSSYLWNYADAFLDMPLGSSDYMYVDEEVPFLSIVLKGILPMYSEYVNFEANKNKFFLQMVEAGIYPSFYITYENSSALIYTNSSDVYSTQYSTYKDTMIEYDQAFREIAEAVDGAKIIKHKKLDNQVTVVTYDNDAAVYINYSDKEQTVHGTTVAAMSYKVGEANE